MKVVRPYTPVRSVRPLMLLELLKNAPVGGWATPNDRPVQPASGKVVYDTSMFSKGVTA